MCNITFYCEPGIQVNNSSLNDNEFFVKANFSKENFAQMITDNFDFLEVNDKEKIARMLKKEGY